jgi:hypothetical protein
MPLDPNIILQAGNFPRADGGQMLRDAFGIVQAQEDLVDRRDARAMQQRQMAAQDAALAKAAKKEARLSTIGSMAASGDVAGAQRTALEAGDFDAYKQIAALSDDQRKAVSAKYAAAAPVALTAAQYPLAVRRNIIMAAAPQLKAAGWSDEEIASFDPNDANIQGLVASQQTVDQINQQLDRDRKFKLDKDKFGYQQKNDEANRGVTIRGQNITMRGQNMTDARAAKSLGPAGVKMTEGQAKDGFNAKRMAGAGAIVDSFENTPGFKPGATGIGAFFGGGQSRQYEAAKGEWVDSLIRMTTGAAATKDEIDAAKSTYFPTALDDSDAITQKAAMRARVMQDAMTRAGPGGIGAAPQQPAKSGWGKAKVVK